MLCHIDYPEIRQRGKQSTVLAQVRSETLCGAGTFVDIAEVNHRCTLAWRGSEKQRILIHEMFRRLPGSARRLIPPRREIFSWDLERVNEMVELFLFGCRY